MYLDNYACLSVSSDTRPYFTSEINKKFQQIAHYNLAKTNEVWTSFFGCLSPAGLCFVHMSKLTWLDLDQVWSVCKSTEFTQVTEAWFGLEKLNIQCKVIRAILGNVEMDRNRPCLVLLLASMVKICKMTSSKGKALLLLARSMLTNQWTLKAG